MRRHLILALSLGGLGLTLGPAAVLAQGATAAADGRVSLSVDEPGSAGGKPLKMTFNEVVREPDHSIAEVTFEAGSSVASSLFVLRGVCAVLRARQQVYVRSDALPLEPRRYRLSFPAQPAAEELSGRGKRVFSVDDCTLLRF